MLKINSKSCSQALSPNSNSISSYSSVAFSSTLLQLFKFINLSFFSVFPAVPTPLVQRGKRTFSVFAPLYHKDHSHGKIKDVLFFGRPNSKWVSAAKSFLYSLSPFITSCTSVQDHIFPAYTEVTVSSATLRPSCTCTLVIPAVKNKKKNKSKKKKKV